MDSHWYNPAILFGLLSVAMTILWVVQRHTEDAGIADLGWSVGVGICAIAFCIWGTGYAPRRVLAGGLVTLWSLRLSLHLLKDRVVPPGEDGRYQMLRQRWGNRAQRKFFVFFQLQVFLMAVFSLPFWAIAADGRLGLTVWDLAAILLATIALTCERVADGQLAVFRTDRRNSGCTLTSGLWNYSRHPNYFFGWLFWWSFVLIGANGEHAWATAVPPVVLFFLLRFATGVPPIEKRALVTRGDSYRNYQQTTNTFVPWFPRKVGR